MTRRADGRVAVSKMVDRRRIWGYGQTRRAAQANLADKIRRIEADRPTRDATTSLREIASGVLRTAEIRETTRTQYLGLLRVHVFPTLGSVPIGRIRPQHLRAVLSAMTTAGLAVSTRRSTYAALRKIFAQAVADDQIAVNPMLAVPRPRPSARPEDRPRPARYLDQDQVRTLMQAAADDRLGPLWSTGLVTGARRGELLALRWSDVELEGGFIRFKRQLQRQTGRGLVEILPKSARGVREVAIPTELVAVLRRHHRRQREEQLRAGQLWQHDGHVFCSETGRPLDPSKVTSMFAKLARTHGLHASPHSMRHTAATMLLTAGRPVNEVAAMLGQSPAVLMTTYAHALPSSQRESAAVLGQAVLG